MKAIEELRARLDELPSHPIHATRRFVYDRLANGYEADLIWPQFDDSVETAGRVAWRVLVAFEQTENEYQRPQSTYEKEDIERVIQLAKELKSTIRAIMPGDTVYHDECSLHAEGLPDVQIDLGWHSLRPDGYEWGYPLAIADDVLEWVVVKAEHHRSRLPVRASARPGGRDSAKVMMLVRHLDWQFRREFGEGKPTAIAHIATALFDLKDNPLTARDVEDKLRDSPLRHPT